MKDIGLCFLFLCSICLDLDSSNELGSVSSSWIALVSFPQIWNITFYFHLLPNIFLFPLRLPLWCMDYLEMLYLASKYLETSLSSCNLFLVSCHYVLKTQFPVLSGNLWPLLPCCVVQACICAQSGGWGTEGHGTQKSSGCRSCLVGIIASVNGEEHFLP